MATLLSISRETLLTPGKKSIVQTPSGYCRTPLWNYKEAVGISYILTKKGKERAGADVGFMLIAYNLRRIGNILTRDVLKEYLRILSSLFLSILGHIEAVLRTFAGINIPVPIFVTRYYHPGKLRKIDLRRSFTR